MAVCDSQLYWGVRPQHMAICDSSESLEAFTNSTKHCDSKNLQSDYNKQLLYINIFKAEQIPCCNSEEHVTKLLYDTNWPWRLNLNTKEMTIIHMPFSLLLHIQNIFQINVTIGDICL